MEESCPEERTPVVVPAPPRYRLVSRIAVGGTSELFLAVMGGVCGGVKPVAIKMLWSDLARDPENVRQFQDESRLSLRLQHPNVVQALESGHDGKRHYLVLEHLHGQSFKHLLDRLAPQGGLSLPLSLHVVSGVLAALEYAHGLTDLRGTPLRIVHRDVSPQNVFLTYDGVVKLVDFGIARTAATLDRSRATGIEGRLAYMAPEQAAGLPVDHRADLFSVGVMLWEAAMGQRMWPGSPDGEIRKRLLSRQPLPPLPETRGFPPGLASICARALAIDPNERYADAAEFQADLAVVLTGSAPVQSRLLGDTLRRLFANERNLVQAMISQALHGQGNPATARKSIEAADSMPGSIPAPVRPGESGSSAEPDRISCTSISTLGEDVTVVRPPRHRAIRRAFIRWSSVGVATGALLFLAGILRPQPNTPPLIVPAVTSLAPAPTAKEPMADITPSADTPEAIPSAGGPNVQAPPAKSGQRRGSPAKGWHPTRPAAKLGHPAPPSPSSIAEAFVDEWRLPARKVRETPSRPLDRQDPYSR